MSTADVQSMKQAHKTLAEFTYEPVTIERGYTGKTLYVNLSDNSIASKPVTEQMKDIFVGGRGFGKVPSRDVFFFEHGRTIGAMDLDAFQRSGVGRRGGFDHA